MATKSFKGFQLVAFATFNGAGFTKDKNTLYFVRTSGDKGNGTDGFLYFNGKKYGTAEDAKTALVGAEDTVDTIKHAEKLATDASKKVDTEIGKLDVTGNVSEAVKGVTVTVDETDGKVIKPVVSIADGTLTGTATDGNLVTGTVVKEYVDGKVSEINTAAGELGTRVTTLEGKVGSEAAGEEAATGLFKKIADETTRAMAAEGQVKTDLIGGATADYNTLGKLETKIKAAQSAADKVSGVKSGDKVLALDGTKLTSTISLSIDATAGDDGKKYIRLKGINGADLGKIDTADFVKDGMLDGSALYTATAATGKVTINGNAYDLSGLTANHAYIVLVWNTDANKAAMAIDVTSLIDTYTAKDGGGLKLEDHAFSVDTTKIATVESVNGVTSRVSTLEGKVTTIQGEGEGSIKKAVKDAADAVKVSVKSADGAYVTASVDAAGRVITLSETVHEVATSSADAKGLAEASDVKAYVDRQVSGKNVSATGDTYVSATAADNKVTVAATDSLKSAVTKANSAVQSVNGVAGTAVVIKATDIEVGAGVSGQTKTATVNAVLADIYTKLGVVVKADGKTIKEAADHTLSVNLEATSDEKVSAGHIEIKQDADTGALYSMMYYSGDDVDAQ